MIMIQIMVLMTKETSNSSWKWNLSKIHFGVNFFQIFIGKYF